MHAPSSLRTLSLAFFVWFASTLLAYTAPTFIDVSPHNGPIGTQVVITANGLDIEATYTVRVDGKTMQLDDVTASTLTFTITSGATSGAIELYDNDNLTSTGLNFTVTRSIPGTFNPPSGVSRNNYLVSGIVALVDPDDATGAFTTSTRLDSPYIATAFREEEDPTFMAVIVSTNTSVVIDATSTAVALAFMSPFLMIQDDASAQEMLARIKLQSQTAELATLIETISADGGDYLNDARVEDKLIAVITGTLNTPPSFGLMAFDPPPPNLLHEINPAYNSGGSSNVRLGYDLAAPNGDRPNDFILSVTNLARNPVDWIVEIIELDPEQFTMGAPGIYDLDFSFEPLVLRTEPVSQGYVRANLYAQKLDILEVLANKLTDKVFGYTVYKNQLSENQFAFEKERAGVYMAQSFSGNFYYGTSFLSGLQSQAGLLNHIDHNSRWTQALIANIAISTIDLISVFVDTDGFLPKDKLILQIIIDGGKAIQVYTASGGLSEKNLRDLIKGLAATAVKRLFNEAVDNGIKKLAKSTAKILASTVDVVGKISSAGQSIERGLGLTTSQTLAVERAVVVIGDPFEPRITAFYPRSGKDGSEVMLFGVNFPTDTEGLVVKFVQFNSSVPPDEDPNDFPTSGELTVEVIKSTANNILIRVPEGWTDVFNTDEAYISVQVTPERKTVTYRLDDPNRTFKYTGLPILTDINPKPVLVNGVFSLHGSNFDDFKRLNNQVIIDNSYSAQIVNASSNLITALLPDQVGNGTHTAKVKIGNIETDAVSFTVGNPVANSEGYSDGLSIEISVLNMSNAPDGQISLLEAFLIANGTLGRPIEQHLDEEFLPVEHPNHIPYQERETDHVVGDSELGGGGGGPTSRDTINVFPALAGNTIMVGQGLPALTSGDTFNLRNIIIDGTGAPANTAGFDFNGVHHIFIKDVTLRNWPGAGLHFRNGSSDNELEDVIIQNTGSHGVHFDDNASANKLIGTMVSNAQGNGLYLHGSNVRYNYITIPSVSVSAPLGLFENCTGAGVRLENGTTMNAIEPGTVRNNDAGGIFVTGSETDFNVIGRNEPAVPRFSDVLNNGHHGVYLGPGVNNTVVRYISPSGNEGDGIRLEGPDCSNNEVDGIFTGIDYFTTFPTLIVSPNLGHGIHLLEGAHHNLIGSRIPGGYGERSSIVANNGAGILLEGVDTAFNTINHMNVGDIETSGYFSGYYPNGSHGIHLRGGAHDNFLGAFHSFLDMHITAAPSAAGIMIEGAGTSNNIVVGNHIGSIHGNNFFPNEGLLQVGIYIKDQASGNTIGTPGQVMEVEVEPFVFQEYRPNNIIGNTTRAAIIIEDAGGTTATNGVILAPNSIQNNLIGVDDYGFQAPNQVGIIITGDSANNMIGGPLDSHGNKIFYNKDAGILIEDNVPPVDSIPTVIMNNDIAYSGSTVSGSVTDHLLSPPYGVGVLIKGTTSNVRVGEVARSENLIYENLVGIFADGISASQISGNYIEDNSIAGIILHNVTGTLVGGSNGRQNTIVNNGNSAVDEGGILISSGNNNRIEANLIGTLGNGDMTGGNLGIGILLQDSSGNFLGSGYMTSGNVVANNTGPGVKISGTSTGNKLYNNFIGTDTLLNALGNGGDGVLLENGAANNLIGGEADLILSGRLVPVQAGNTISHNGINGVNVDGATSVGNSILNNSITANTQAGIRHTSGGNNDQLPPIAAIYDGSNLTGTVPDLTAIPAGSHIEVFADADPNNPEGAQFLGSGTVKPGGSWSIDGITVPLFHKMTMTATHATTKSTSPFGTDLEFNIALEVTRTGNTTPANQNAPSGVSVIPVMPFSVGTLNAQATILSLKFDASGTLDDQANISAVKIYRDSNKNGIPDASDRLISTGGAFNADNGSVTISIEDGDLEANKPQQWLLVYETSASAPVGATLKATLTDVSSVNATYVYPYGIAAVPTDNFPLDSDTFTLSAISPIQTWRNAYFSPEELGNSSISGDNADPDNDGLPNLVEYALGLDPRNSDVNGRPQAEVVDGFLVFQYRRSKTATDVVFSLQASQNLPSLVGISGLFEETSVDDNEDGTETVTVRSTQPVANNSQLFLILNVSLGGS